MRALSPLIDFHSHILPGADHGSSGIEETRKQLSLLREAGVDTVVATPHFYPHRHRAEDFLLRVASAAEKLTEADRASPRVCVGAEVLYCDRLDEMEGLERLCVQGTNVLLLELPLEVFSYDLFDTVQALTDRYTVVLAHIDRYIRAQREGIERLLEEGAYAQINASAFFSFSERRRLAPLLGSDRIVALGSDLHNTDRKSCEQLADARKRLGDEYDAIMARSAALLKDATYL